MSAPTTGVVGVVGLGIMGTAAARCLGEQGWTVVATSRSQGSRDGVLGAPGVSVVPSVTALVDGLDAVLPSGVPLPVLTSLTDGTAVGDVARTLVGALPRGRRLLLVDTSTCHPDDARTLAALLADGGHLAVDAPVSGGPVAARAGTLSVMAGGSDAAIAAAGPLLDALAARVTRCGAAGSGQVVKAANQAVVAGTLEAVAEGLTLAAAHGVDAGTVREALLPGYAASAVLDAAGARMVARDFATVGSVGLLAKDLAIIADLAATAGLDLPAVAVAQRQAARLAALDPSLDHSALITLLDRTLEPNP